MVVSGGNSSNINQLNVSILFFLFYISIPFLNFTVLVWWVDDQGLWPVWPFPMGSLRRNNSTWNCLKSHLLFSLFFCFCLLGVFFVCDARRNNCNLFQVLDLFLSFFCVSLAWLAMSLVVEITIQSQCSKKRRETLCSRICRWHVGPVSWERSLAIL